MDINSLIALNDAGLFALANDTQQSMLCDWREEPEAVVEYANAFLPKEQRLAYTEDEDELVLSNRQGRYAVAYEEYEEIDEPIPLLVREINKLIAPTHEARYFRCVDGTDAYCYFLRPAEFWRTLDSEHQADSERIFRKP